ncbi:MAG: NAD(P)-dependent oxidoreductase [Spirochaetales bacterium]|jgi:nucleoside-diphosphate-sugar epimerase|nr:NAD(P)-dependent oxidoreductase [Exilispira sp.]NMC67248.1 NAD(P)-dependent oxidoreductase [Spirochaetales bacterium]
MRLNIGFTGISGMLGKNFLDFYLKDRELRKKYRIIGLSRNISEDLIKKYKDNSDDLVFRNINYFDQNSLKNALESIDILIHSAGVTKGNYYEIFQKGNVEVTENLIKVIENEKLPIKNFIFISSQSVLGPSDLNNKVKDIFFDEESKSNPISSYGKSKTEAEIRIKNSNINWSIIRFPTIFGKYEMDSLILFKFANKGIMLDTSWEYFTLSYILAEDGVELIFNLIDKMASDFEMVNKKVYHFCYDKPIRIRDFMNEIMGFSNKKVVLKILAPRFLFKITALILTLISILNKKAIIINKEKVNEFLHSRWLMANDKTKKLLSLSNIERKANLQEIYEWYKEEGLI